jgi:hypothetical protein
MRRTLNEKYLPTLMARSFAKSKWAAAFFLIAFASSPQALLAQSQNQTQNQTQSQLPISNREQSATYISQIDDDLTIRRIALLPVTDNVEGIYARNIEAQLTQILKSSHRWDFVEANFSGAIPTLVELEESPATVRNLVQAIDADAFVGATLTRGPKGLSIRVDLFLKKDGRVLSQELLRDHPRFEMAEIRQRTEELFRRMVARVPYEGLVLSRQGNRVTINLGKSDGINKDQNLTVVQIIGVNRHPKFSFLVSSEKEILGRIKILKVDETLSFGAIVSEKEKDVIRRLAKISGIEQVSYAEPNRLEDGTPAEAVANRGDNNVTFGKDPKEWLPARTPAFGQFGARLGLGGFNTSVATSASGTLQANATVYPSIGVDGELWLTPQWTMRAEILQGVISTPNPRPGATAGTINQSLSRYSLAAVYNFLLREDFFGPKFGFSAGVSSTRLYADAATPDVFETTNFSGAFLGLEASFPVSDAKLWYVGGRVNLYIMPNMSETPNHSGTSYKNSVNEFSLFMQKKLGENLRAVGSLDFSLYSSSISGQGNRIDPAGSPTESATSLSQRFTTLSGGIVYMY